MSKKPFTPLGKVFIHASGDPSVGIPAITIEVSELSIIVEPEDIEKIRHSLRQTFSEIYDERVSVQFEHERDEYEQYIDEQLQG